MARKLIYLTPAAVLAALLAAFALGLGHDPHLLPSALIDRPAPEFALPGLYDGANGLTRKDLDGRITVINFFASWCVPCREEQPALMELARRRGVILDGIAYKDKPDESRRFLDRFGNPYALIGVDSSGTTGIDFGVYGVPETYVVDAAGRIRYRHVGPLTAADVRDKILPVLVRMTAAGGAPAG